MGAIPLQTGPQDPSQLQAAINALIQQINGVSTTGRWVRFNAPIAAELVSISAAAIATNRALTIAGQPDYPRKLQIRQVIVTAITAGTLTLVGKDASGNAQTKAYSLVAAATQTVITNEAWSHVTSATVTGLVGGGDGTLGIGVGAALGLPLPLGFNNLVVYKEDVDNADETVGTVDNTAGTVAPTTAANGTHNFDFWYSLNAAV